MALHGWARSGADFSRVVDGLDAVAIHLPGFGITPEPTEAWGSEDYADDLADALAGLPPVIVVGHSFGGRVAVRLAAKHPELVRGLVLTGVPLLRLAAAPKASASYRAVRWLAKRGLVSPKALEAQRQKHGSADYKAARGVMRDVLVKAVSENYNDDLARIACPVRMVWGENDTAAPADAGLAASRLLADASFRTVPGAGHLLEGALVPALREELHTLIEQLGPNREAHA
ncbi:pimeloyl-ACP methyl ester carboxylesterase [Homoserinimonas aerilata]|uniref:Pimeloyl-ACP methyl ester carboxylesterase n=1 Tax=Homoserinimonas aerilata TaxID=1162970 RepID=A0A542YHS1_9MICO|nr:pimeloyl-ACP methyl ester carboxylesterase [Homoserinimonas aerilata]